MHQHITRPTRYRQGQTECTLDLVLTDVEDTIEDIRFFDGLGLSDHIIICFELSQYLRLVPKQKLPKPNYARADWDGMRNELCTAELTTCALQKSTQESWDHFESTMKRLTEKFVPMKKPPRKKRNLYMTYEALKLRRRKEKLWTRYTKTGRDIDHAEYARARNKLRKMTRSLKRAFENNLVSNVKNRPKAFWAYVGSKIKTNPGIGTLEKVDGSLAATEQAKAEALNHQFTSVFTQEDLAEVPTLDRTFEGDELCDIMFSSDRIRRELQALDVSKSSGPDGLHPAILKELASEISPFLALLFKKSLDEGAIPRIWKCANVTPIFKSGSKHKPENYRPISLTPVLCKIMEKIIRDEIREHLLQNNLVCPHQHGFLPGKSTSSQLLECTEEWSELLEQGKTVDVVYLDFKKAFDSVPHQRLLKKICAYGIRGKVLEWMTCFLTGRTQRVVVEGHASPWVAVTSGIPQGSVLGPLCFIIFINDLPQEIKTSIKMYADDAKIYGPADSAQDRTRIQEDINAVERWTTTWQLPLNTKKCKVLHLGSKNGQQKYYLNGNVIENTLAEKDLGIIMESSMKFHQQCSCVVKKANRILGLVKNSFDYINETSISLLYKALIRPIIEYSNVVWGPIYKMDMKKIEQIQRRATRLIPSLRPLPYEARLQQTGLPSLLYRRRRGDMITVYKMLTGKTSGKHLLNLAQEEGRTRGHRFKIKKVLSKKDVRRHRFSQRIVDAWNSLPSDVVEAKSVATFKIRLDKYWHNKMYLVE